MPTAVWIAVLPAPPTVSPTFDPLTVPPRVNVPASDETRDALPKLSVPLWVLSPLRLRSTPPADTPVPLIVRFSEMVMLFDMANTAPLSTVVAPAVVPSAAELPTSKVPVATRTAPLNALTPESVSVEAPSL